MDTCRIGSDSLELGGAPPPDQTDHRPLAPLLPPRTVGTARSHQADASTYDGVEAFWRFIESLGRLQRRVNED
jgi:hypothetical protein